MNKPRWHYQILSWWVKTWLDGKMTLEIENALNRMGNIGWELVSFIYSESEQSAVAILRLPIAGLKTIGPSKMKVVEPSEKKIIQSIDSPDGKWHLDISERPD